MKKNYLNGLIDRFLQENQSAPDDEAQLRLAFSKWLAALDQQNGPTQTSESTSRTRPSRRRLPTRKATREVSTPSRPSLHQINPDIHPVLNLYFQKARKGILHFPSLDRLEYYRQSFLDRFGPKALRSLSDMDAIAVLANTKSAEFGMDYWLEIRQDDIFDGRVFGSIKGGSAAKFTVWQDSDGTWKRLQGRQSVACEIDTVASIVGQRRDELIAASEACAKWAGQSLEERDPWLLAESIAVAAPTYWNAMWLHKYLHIVVPNVLGNIRPAAIRLFGMNIEGSGRFGLPRVDNMPAAIAIDAHIGNLLASFPALAWVPPLQRWSLVRQGFTRQITFLDQSFQIVANQLSVVDKEVADLRKERPPRRGQNRMRLKSLGELRLSHPGDLVMLSTGQIATLKGNDRQLSYQFDGQNGSHSWVVDVLHQSAQKTTDIGVIETELIQAGHGPWPAFFTCVGPPNKRTKQAGKFRLDTESRVHAELAESILQGGPSSLTRYSLLNGLSHLLLQPDLKKVRRVLLNPLVHFIALRENGVAQVMAAWQRLGEKSPEVLWRRSIDAHLAEDNSREVLRSAVQFALNLQWNAQAAWFSDVLYNSDEKNLRDYALIAKALIRTEKFDQALSVLRMFDSKQRKENGLHRDYINLLIATGDLTAAQRLLDKTVDVSLLSDAEAIDYFYLYGRLRLKRKDLDNALVDAHRALEERTELVGKDGFSLVPILQLIYEIHVVSQQTAQAIETLEEMIRLSRNQFGPGHAFVLDLLQQQSQLLDNKDSIVLLREALRMGNVRLGDDAPILLPLRISLAQSLFNIGEVANAVAVLEQSLVRAETSTTIITILTKLLLYSMDSDTSMAKVWVFRLLTTDDKPSNEVMEICIEAFERLELHAWANRLRNRLGKELSDLQDNVVLPVFQGDSTELRSEVNRLQKVKGRRHPDTLAVRYTEWRKENDIADAEELWADMTQRFGRQHPAALQVANEMNRRISSTHVLLADPFPWFTG